MSSLRAKYFTVILAVNVVLAGGLYLFLQYSFESDFTNYVSQRERELSDNLVVELENYYQRNGNWQAFAEHSRYWRGFVLRYNRPDRRVFDHSEGGEGSRGRGGRDRRMDPMEAMQAYKPFFLLDATQNPVAGYPRPRDESLLRPIEVEGNTVGFLGVPISPEMRDYLDRQFASSQSKNLIVVVLASLLFALVAAIPLSRLMVTRIGILVGQVKRLSMGRYNEPLTLRGNDELNVLAIHLADLGKTLKKSEQQRSELFADVSHELRTPVAILQADLEALEDGVRNLDQNAIARLLEHVARLKKLINDLHELSLSDLGSLSYRKEACDLPEIVAEAIDLMDTQFERKGLSFSYQQAEGKDFRILADSARLTQLLLNLLHNSLKYTDVPGSIQLRLKQEADSAVIEISDSAPGVDSSLYSRLTERLFRVESSRSRDSGGAGIGLSLCANIVAAHGGRLKFSDSELGGLKVTIELPLIKGDS